MEKKYRITKNTTSLINYHFVFCPRYRRKIFDIDNVTERFFELVSMVCKNIEAELLTIECYQDYAYILIESSPALSPSDIMQKIKTYTSKILREEFIELRKMPSLWTRSYFVSTDSISNQTIKRYVESQRTRY